jgi:hypothetical protein
MTEEPLRSVARRSGKGSTIVTAASAEKLTQIITDLGDGKPFIKFSAKVENLTGRFLISAKNTTTLTKLDIDGPFLNPAQLRELCRLVESSRSLQHLKISAHALNVDSINRKPFYKVDAAL